jgi:cytochrome c-type biogenesis protein CcmH
MRLFLSLVFLFFLTTAQASIEAYEFDSAQTEADYYKLINELRCLVCQNQNLSGSNAELAQDLRRQTYEMLTQGDSPEQVVEFMVARYGDFVLYRPQFKASTYLLWLGPFVLLAIVLYLVISRVRATSTAGVVSDDAMDEAKQLLQQDPHGQ